MILCGGAYNSPQLLMLSGVGPAEHLAMREIEVLLDQPAVGENLSDHAATYGVWTTPEPESLLLALEPAALEEFAATQTGPFASNFAEAGGFARVEAGAEAPDVQFHVAPIQIVDEGMSDPTAHGVWVSPCLLTPRAAARCGSPPKTRPRSRSSATTSTAPRSDMARMIAALRLTRGDLRPAGAAALLRRAFHGAGRRLRRGLARPRRRAPPTRSTTRSAPARSARWSTPSCGSRAWRASASSTPR